MVDGIIDRQTLVRGRRENVVIVLFGMLVEKDDFLLLVLRALRAPGGMDLKQHAMLRKQKLPERGERQF